MTPNLAAPAPAFRLKHKREAAERVIRGEAIEIVAASLHATSSQVEKWHKQYVSGGKNNLRYTCDENEIPPDLDAIEMSAQRAFPVRLLNQCNTAASFFCARYYGKNDTIHLYSMGVPHVTLIDNDAARTETMRSLYPQDWEVYIDDAFDVVRRFVANGRKFDMVVCDTHTTVADRANFSDLHLFTAIAAKYLLLMYQKKTFDALGISPEPAPLSAALTRELGFPVHARDVILRSTYCGGTYWSVIVPTVQLS